MSESSVLAAGRVVISGTVFEWIHKVSYNVLHSGFVDMLVLLPSQVWGLLTVNNSAALESTSSSAQTTNDTSLLSVDPARCKDYLRYL